MRACSNCKTEIPDEYGGASCPSCKARLPSVTSRRPASLTPLTGAAIEQAAAAARARATSDHAIPSVRPAPIRSSSQRAPADEDKWDLPPDEASLESPSIPRPPGVPSGFGRPASGAGTPGSGIVAPGPRPPSNTLALGRITSADAAKLLADAEAARAAAVPAPEPEAPRLPQRATVDQSAGHVVPPVATPVTTRAHSSVPPATPSVPPATPSAPPAAAPSSAGVPGLSRRPSSSTLVLPGVAIPAGAKAPPAAGAPPAPRPSSPTLVGTAPVLAPPAGSATASSPPPGKRTSSATLIGTAAVLPPAAESSPPSSPGLRASGTLVGLSAPVIPPVENTPGGGSRDSAAAPVAIDAAPAAVARSSSPTPPAAQTTAQRPRASLAPPSPADRTGARSATSSTPPATATQRQRPVLASDVLRDDLVPREPGARALRVSLGLAGAVLVALAARHGLGDLHALAGWGIPGITALLVAIAPLSYGTRALLSVAPALPAFAVQAAGAPGTSVSASLLWTAVCAWLPASLLFRANFRASRRARVFVALALACALGWAMHPSGGAVWVTAPGWAAVRMPGIALVAVCLLSLMAFMGNNTTGGCRAWAVAAVAWSALAAAWPGALAAAGDVAARTDAILGGVGMGCLCAVLAVSIAALLAEYVRPSEPNTGIGLAATMADRSGANPKRDG